MKLVVKTSRRELVGVGGIWGFLLLISLVAWLLLKVNANRIINYIEYVETGRFGRAVVLYDEGRKNARSVIERSYKLNENSRKKVMISQTDPEVQAALNCYERAERLDPRQAFDPGRETHYDFKGQIYDVTGNSMMQWLSYSEAFLCRGDISNARQYVKLAAEISSSSSEVLLLTAFVGRAAGETSAALQALDDLYASNTIPTRARMLKASLLQSAGLTDEGIKDLQMALVSDPANADIYKMLAQMQISNNQPADAVATFQSGLDKGGNTDGNYMHLYGMLLFDQGQIKESIAALELASEMEPSSGDIMYGLARSYQKDGQPGLAGRALQRAIKLNPALASEVF